MHIRPAIFTDMDALSGFAGRVFADNFGMLYDEADMRAHLEKTCSAEFFAQSLAGGEVILLLLDDEKIAGYAKIGPLSLPLADAAPGAAEIHRFYLDETYCGRGFGAQLMEEALALPVVQAAPELYLGVWENNFRAQAFYKRYGFAEVGEYPYYVGKTVDRELILKRFTPRCGSSALPG